MMKRTRMWLTMLCTLLLVLLVVPGIRAQAAGSTGYVMAGENSYTSGGEYVITSAKVNGYKVRIRGNKLEVRKGSGRWKTLVRNSRIGLHFTTNGRTIYYTVDNNPGTTIYSISVSGKNKKKITKISEGYSEICYRYGDKLFINGDGMMGAGYYSSSTGKVKVLKTDYRICDAKKKYVIFKYCTTGGEPCIDSYYSYNAATGKMKRLTSKAEDYSYAVSKNRFYYVYWPKDAGYDKAQTFQVKSCKLDGTDYKTHTGKFQARYITGITTKYVTYENMSDGKVHKLNFK